MGKDIIDVTLSRENSGEPWGFRLAGGKDQGQPLSISQVTKNSLTQKAGLLANDFLISIAGQDVYDLTHEQAEECIHGAGDRFTMVIERMANRKISFENSATTFALRVGGGAPEVVREAEVFVSNVPYTAETPALAGGVNFKKFEKKAVDFSASKTLEDAHSKANLQKDWNTPWVSKDGSRLKQAVRYVEEPTAPAKTSQQHYYSTPGSILAPEPQISKEELEALIREHGQDSRPGSRAQQSTQSMLQSKYQEDVVVEKEQFQQQEETREYNCREREEDSQAPPDLEPVSLGYEQFQQTSMAGYGDTETPGYEPSADELIEVLKNLENLAAADPALYRTIVDQIKGGPIGLFPPGVATTNGQVTDFEYQLMEQQREAEIYRQQQQQQLEMQRQQQQLYEEQTRLMLQQEQTLKLESTEEVSLTSSRSQRQETSRHQHQVTESVVDTKQGKTKELNISVMTQPKEITVIAGDGKAVKVQLGGEIVEEDSRRQVAEAAGLKHVPLPDFDNTQNSAWAGSLKKTERNKLKAQECDGENPWAGSLRHVEDTRKDKTRKDGTETEKEGGSNAPWMGTLRHVVHDNKVTKHFGVNQFQSKRYPDEDAGNPFEGTGGMHSRPHFPLTPAAVINGSVMSRDEMAKKEEEEEVERIRSNLGSCSVSTALMQALMPKLLKMHEAKYEPMDKVDAQAIMEGILGMQAGLNPDQQADANEEAEMIIRAIMQEEIDKSIYSKMADDLETAKKRMNKKKTKKVSSARVGVTA